MGCAYSKPWKNSSEDVVGAYRWDGRDCGCGSNEFKLMEEPDDKEFGAVKDAIESNMTEAVDLVLENQTRSCCCDAIDYGAAIDAMNIDLFPSVNAKIEPLGYVVDAFAWTEWQYNGTSSYKISFLVLRIREVGVTTNEAKEE